MHTVIILNEHSSRLLKDFRFLFRPFIDEGEISFCDWNTSGTDLNEAVPNLYKVIKGKPEWRAIILNTEHESEDAKCYGSFENPFDFSENFAPGEIPAESPVPLIRLTHMLSGYPRHVVSGFEEAFEYLDYRDGRVKRIRTAKHTREDGFPDEKLQKVLDNYKDSLKRVYLEEEITDEVREAIRRLSEKYNFLDSRPRELYLIATRKHQETDAAIHSAWTAPFEVNSDDFCHDNNYPDDCRFVCYDITNRENSSYLKELLEFWTAVLSVAINTIPASALQAYRLYQLGIELSTEELERTLNEHLDKMEAAYNLVQEHLTTKPNYDFERNESYVESQRIQVIYDNVIAPNLSVDSKKIGLTKDCPEDEIMFWNRSVREIKREVAKYVREPKHAVSRASRDVRRMAESFGDEEYELEKYQIEELKDELDEMYLKILCDETRWMIDEHKIKEDLEKKEKSIRKKLANRMYRRTAVTMGGSYLLVLLVGLIPLLFNAMSISAGAFLSLLFPVIAVIGITALAGLAVLFIKRHISVSLIESFNSHLKDILVELNNSAKSFSDYLTMLCTYMKAQAMYDGATDTAEHVSSRIKKLRSHRSALRQMIRLDKSVLEVFGLSRNAKYRDDVTRYFHEENNPKESPVYYYEANTVGSRIPLNYSGEEVITPYRFVQRLNIERLELYSKTEEEE